ncbi:hypothetical protein LTR50_006695 [Elasticomyces elasticus]|nr:hypothetical protein LTR50_006695 [Elasticomyces elasticus]
MKEQPNSHQHTAAYPSPHVREYPSPSMNPPPNAYGYAPNGQHPQESYRASPPGPNMTHPTSLPPIHHLPSQNAPQQQSMGALQMQHSHTNGSNGYPPDYASYGHSIPSSSIPSNGSARFPIPAQSIDTRQMSGGRHKKEIKRRTKTGCLTCRKRRIKCDETHPTCRNCTKSKRDCLGYDPVFKPQQAPPTLQPAPGSTPCLREPSSVHAQTPNPYGAVPPGYASAVTAGYNSTVTNAQYDAPAYDFSAPIDPALGSVDPSLHMAEPVLESTLQPQRRVKNITVDALFTLGNMPPPVPPSDDVPLSAEKQEEIATMYAIEYAPGLDKFFESTWFVTVGPSRLQEDTALQKVFAFATDLFRRYRSDDYELMNQISSLEAQLVWLLACMPSHAEPVDTQARVIARRVLVVEKLLTGQFLDRDSIPQEPTGEPPKAHGRDQHVYYQSLFWYQLGTFLSLRDDEPNLDAFKEIDATLKAVRNLLAQLENRDVLYSMSIARHLGGRVSDFPDRPIGVFPPGTEPADVRNSVEVAKKFIIDEAFVQGTTQVVQRLCGMCQQSWTLLKP